MKQLSLNGIWSMTNNNGVNVEGTIPGSVYSFLLNAGLMEDPFYRENELDALKLLNEDYSFSRTFQVPSDYLQLKHQILRFDGIDTIADIFLNGQLIGHAENFHCYREFDVTGLLQENNSLCVLIKSPLQYIRDRYEEAPIGGSPDAMKGFPYIRKPHCMFGWDWGPHLPDAGIWKNVSLLGWDRSRILDLSITQEHDIPEAGMRSAALTVCAKTTDDQPVTITLTSPDGRRTELADSVPYTIADPELWWPNGLGGQPLYTVTVTLDDPSGPETAVRRIGLRTLTVARKEDAYGESFALEVNGRTFFAMGANYIPEDNIFSRQTEDRTRELLSFCREAHFNSIRVWGGGAYPPDYFYDACDEAGIVVWQDMMFACASYRASKAFIANVSEEIRQQAVRIRHHACLGVWSGNNENEDAEMTGVWGSTDTTRRDYMILNEYVIPSILNECAPSVFYWPSSPSSGGAFDMPMDPDRGDMHYWDVWHGGKPFTEYRKFHFRFLSEFGFQSFPCMETIQSFTLPEDRNVFSRVMERHQRNAGANGRILQYVSMNYLYPASLDLLVYASQLLQAEAIRYGVEHLRRNRNDDRCMGTLYWQLNDIWPAASWSSVDYYHRWKALQYYAKRFYAPIMISCAEVNEITARVSLISEPTPNISTAALCVTNETWEETAGTVEWELRDAGSRIIESGSREISVPAFHSTWLDELDFSDTDYLQNHLLFRYVVDGEIISQGTVLFTTPKHYRFIDPELTLQVQGDRLQGDRLQGDRLQGDQLQGDQIIVTAGAFAKSVEVYSESGYVQLSDNYFDMEAGTKTIRVISGERENLRVRSVYDIR